MNAQATCTTRHNWTLIHDDSAMGLHYTCRDCGHEVHPSNLT